MNLRRSPTLDLAAAIEVARQSGQSMYSLSTPTFFDRSDAIRPLSGATFLPPAMGAAELREWTRSVFLDRWDLPEHDVLITVGAKSAILSALRAACSAGDRILIFAPYWPSYAAVARLLFMEPVVFESRAEDNFAVDHAALSETLKRTRAKAIIFSNPNNPVGRIHPGGEIQAIADIAREFESLLLIDESFSGIVFEPDKWRQSTCSTYERLVVVNSFSKNYHLQGLRVGMCAAHADLLGEIVSAHQAAISAAPSLSQEAVLAMLRSNHNPPGYEEGRALAMEFVREREWPCHPSEGTFYMFPRLADVDRFEAEGRASSVLLLRGGIFGAAYDNHIRLCFGKPAAELRQIFGLLNSGNHQR